MSASCFPILLSQALIGIACRGIQMHSFISSWDVNMIRYHLMPRTYVLPVGAFFLIVGSLTSDISMSSCGTWQLDHDSESNLDTSVTLWEKKDCLLIDCALWCERNASCRSFFHHPSQEICLGSQSYKRGLPAGQEIQQEWKYFTKLQYCDGGYEYNQTLGLCYKVHSETINCSDAMAACEKEGAKLIIIRNEIEFQFIQSLASFTWIGLRATGTNFVWKWWNGQAASYFRWYPGSPDNDGRKQTCVTICYGTYRDDDCDILRPFICQKHV